jgi:hypothetical protein
MGALGHTPTAHYKAMFVTGYEEAHGAEHGKGEAPAAGRTT